MIETKYQQNDVLYLVRSTAFAKCLVEEIIIHYTQKEIIVKYIVRPFGSDVKNCVPMNENELYSSLEEVKNIVKKNLEDVYVKSLENIINTTDEMFDSMELEYQSKKENK